MKLSKNQKKEAIDKIMKYHSANLEYSIGELAAELYLDFIIEELGILFYNQGVFDVQNYMKDRVDDIYALVK